MQQTQEQKVLSQLSSLTHNDSNLTITNSVVKGYDFNQGVDYSKMFSSYKTMGIQATNLSLAMDQLNNMIKWRGDQGQRCTIFLGYTSNCISSGMREIIRYLCEHKMVDAIVTTCGGIEEDFIKCMGSFYVGNFNMNDHEMRKNKLNRIGNIFLESKNYEKFEDWINIIFQEMYDSQIKNNIIWSPSKMIKLMGEKINNPESVYYWAAKNDIPVFCPAITDGAIGDMLFANSYKNEGFILDLTQDVIKINKMALDACKSGCFVLGGGVVKHHIMNANIWRNGADFGVFVNTGIEYDASDAGATPSEAISWGKLQLDSNHVKIFSEFTLVLPILVAETFVKHKELATKFS